MTKTRIFYLILITTLVYWPSMAMAEVTMEDFRQISSSGNPLDTALSGDGQLFFVLTLQGSVEIYSADGNLKDTLQLANSADRIVTSRSGDRIYLSDSRNNIIKVIRVDFVQTISTEGSPIKGTPGAPVTIAVFTDFQCPYCAKAVPLLDQVLEQYPGKVNILFKNFPLRMHEFAIPSALAALAADKQGRFWPMHDLLFQSYNNLSEEKILECARLAGLDIEKFNSDRNDPKTNQQVQMDLKNGQSAGVRGTPTIFVNGYRLKKRGMKGLKKLVDAELQKLAVDKNLP